MIQPFKDLFCCLKGLDSLKIYKIRGIVKLLIVNCSILILNYNQSKEVKRFLGEGLRVNGNSENLVL
jgi:hypothetical protein